MSFPAKCTKDKALPSMHALATTLYADILVVFFGLRRNDWYVQGINNRLVLVSGGGAVVQDPSPEDPLNKEAAEMLQNSQRQFEASVQASILRGTYINNSYFPPCRA